MLQGSSDLGTGDSCLLFASSIIVPHGIEEIVKTIGHDDVVVDGNDEADDALGNANAPAQGTHAPDGDRASLGELAKGELHVVHGLADEEEEGEVADEERPTPVAIGKGRKSPNIAWIMIMIRMIKMISLPMPTESPTQLKMNSHFEPQTSLSSSPVSVSRSGYQVTCYQHNHILMHNQSLHFIMVKFLYFF